MSFNRLKYDSCAYEKKIKESVSPSHYMLDPIRFENCNKCRPEFGVVGGTNVSLERKNLVDVESDLRGQTRKASQCPSQLYQPECKSGQKKSTNKVTPYDTGLPCIGYATADYHLRPCNIFQYKPTPMDSGLTFEYPKCPNQRDLDHTFKSNMPNYINNEDTYIRGPSRGF
jgi:hypothetical protein